MDTIVGDLAERWSWQDNYKNLVFFLRKDVKWHDGKPFTSKDVKFTFDMLREAPDAPAKLRINPRKDWYANIEHVEAADPYTVVFRMKRPQPSLLMMLASGYTPIYAAHIPPAQYRTSCVGTGPFKLKEWRRGEFVEYVKNPDYFVKGRPYLDGLKYVVIVERGHPDGGAPGRAARHGLPRRDVEDDDGPAQEGRAPDGVPPGRAGRHRQHHHERQEGAVRQPEGAAGRELRHRPPRPDPGRRIRAARSSAPRCCRAPTASGA